MDIFFNWCDFGNEIILRFVDRPLRTRTDKPIKKRDWAKEHQKRIIAGTAYKKKKP